MKQKKVYVKAMCEVNHVEFESVLATPSFEGVVRGFDSEMGTQGVNSSNDNQSEDTDGLYDDKSGYDNDFGD